MPFELNLDMSGDTELMASFSRWADEDLAEGITQVDVIMADSKPYSMSRHYCGHDERKSCEMVKIKVVK